MNTLTTINNILIISIIVTIIAIIYLFYDDKLHIWEIYYNLRDKERIYYQMEQLENRIRKDFNNIGTCNVCFNN